MNKVEKFIYLFNLNPKCRTPRHFFSNLQWNKWNKHETQLINGLDISTYFEFMSSKVNLTACNCNNIVNYSYSKCSNKSSNFVIRIINFQFCTNSNSNIEQMKINVFCSQNESNTFMQKFTSKCTKLSIYFIVFLEWKYP